MTYLLVMISVNIILKNPLITLIFEDVFEVRHLQDQGK